MSPREQMELFRLKMRLMAERAEMEKNLVFETIFVAQEMNMKVEEVLELDAIVYNYIVQYLKEKYEKREQAAYADEFSEATLG